MIINSYLGSTTYEIPTDNLVAYYEAISPNNTVSSNLVGTLADEVGSSDFTQATTANKPYKKGNTIYFDGSNDILTLDPTTTDWLSDNVGEVVVLMARRRDNQTTYGFGVSDKDTALNYIYFGTGSSGGNIIIRHRNNTDYANETEDGAIDPYKNLELDIYSFVSTGSEYKLYRNGVLVTSTGAQTGGLDGDWFSDCANIDTASLGGLAYNSSTLFSEIDLGGMYYYDAVLSDDDREQLKNYIYNKFFGSTSPKNKQDNYLTPNQTYSNTRYNWDGGLAKDPTSNTITALWSKGDSHYTFGDLHDIVGHNSTDGGESFGSEFTVVSGGSNMSYTNPSIGYDSNGRLHTIYTKVDHSADPWENVGLFSKYSDDNGSTWSTEYTITGITYLDYLNSNSKIIESDGNLYATYYEINESGNAYVNLLRSTDNGVSWSIYTNIDTTTWGTGTDENINETAIELIDTDTFLCVTRCNGKEYYNQYLSTNNGATWTDQGQTSLCDYWDATGATGTSSANNHRPRLAKFTYNSTDFVALIYMNRGIYQIFEDETYMRLIIAKVSDISVKGINAWADSSAIKLRVDGLVMDNLDGYPDIIFPDGGNVGLIMFFEDTNGTPGTVATNGTLSDIHYIPFEIPQSYINAVLDL